MGKERGGRWYIAEDFKREGKGQSHSQITQVSGQITFYAALIGTHCKNGL